MKAELIKNFTKTQLFDGDEADLYNKTFNYPGDYNGSALTFKLGNTQAFSELKNRLGETTFGEVAKKIPNATESKLFPGFYKGTENLALEFVNSEDGHNEYIVVVSIGESQPGRHKVYLEGIWRLLPSV